MYTDKVFVLWMITLLSLVTRGDFPSDVLDEHNKYRELHGCPNLALNSELSQDCNQYAVSLAEKNAGLEHSTGDYGENLCLTTGDPLTCVKMWYDEIKDYDFDKAEFSSATGHFTQVIWKGSKEIGVGLGTSTDGTKFVVARYKPAGNMKGAFKENVPKLTSGAEANKPVNYEYFIAIMWIFPALFLQAS